MNDQVRPRSQMMPAIGAILLFVGGAWIASQGGLWGSTADSSSKFFGTWFQFVRSMPILLSLWIGAIGLGAPIRLWLVPNAKHWLIVQAACGWGILLMLNWLAAWFGILNGWTAWGFCGLGLAVWTYHFGDPVQRQRWHPDNWPSPPWTLLLALPALGFMFVACSCPPGTLWSMEAFGYDVTTYHLQVPREWLAHGGMFPMKHNVYSHLPLFNEAGSLQVSAMHGSVFGAIYTTQFLHASMALFAAVAMAKLVSSVSGPAAGVFGGVTLLVLPWTLVTGSLSYNEMFVLAFGASALLVVFDDATKTKGAAGLLGFLLGCATLSKLTAGAMIAMPIGALLLLGLRNPKGNVDLSRAEAETEREARGAVQTNQRATKPAIFLGMAVLVGILTLTPFLLRNTLWTGNPVFPFATSVLGSGDWTPEQVERWSQGHAGGSLGEGLSDLPRQWFLNTGFGAVLGNDVGQQKATDVARFQSEYGLPLFWLVAFGGAAFGMAKRSTRRISLAMLIILGFQLLFWLVATHHQSRFLIPTLLPGCVLVGLAFGRVSELLRDRVSPVVSVSLAVAFVLVLTLSSLTVLQQETLRFVDQETNQIVQMPVWQVTDSLIEPGDVTLNQPGRFVGYHPLNERIKPHALFDKVSPPGAVLMLTHGGRLIYIHRSISYNSPFDRSVIGELLERYDGDVNAVSISLLKSGITHVWISYSELRRLAGSYGLHKRLTPEAIQSLVSHWHVAATYPRQQAALYDLRKVAIRLKPKNNGEENPPSPPANKGESDKDQ